MSKPDFYVASDYIGIETNLIEYYYGYEETEDDEWCFVAKLKKDDSIIYKEKYSTYCDDQFDVVKCFNLGLANYLDKFHLYSGVERK